MHLEGLRGDEVVKSDGTYRFTVDYRRLNDVVETDRFNIPTTDSVNSNFLSFFFNYYLVRFRHL